MSCDVQPTEARKRKSITQRVSDFKRQKPSFPQTQCHSQSREFDFWDGLSKIWLTKYALREFDRRTRSQADQLLDQATRPRTRSYLKELQQRPRSIRSIDNFPDGYSLHTQRQIKLSARHGGVDLSDLRGFPEPTSSITVEMRSSKSGGSSRNQKRGSASSSKTETTTTQTTVTRKTTNSQPKDANYQQRLIDNGIYPYGYKYPDGSRPPLPSNWEKLNRRLAEARPSLSPSRFTEEDYQRFVDADACAFNEDAVKESVIPTMLTVMGAADGAYKNVQYTNMEEMITGISQAKPDYYYGARPEQISLELRDNQELNKHIIPSGHTHLPAVPNFFLEVKGPDGSLAAGLRQACHDGAIGARAMRSLHAFVQEKSAYDNYTQTMSLIYYGGALKMYGHSVAQPKGPGTRPEYYMHQINGWSMTGNQASFIEGATAYKNAMDLTAEFRNAAIERANAIARRRSAAMEKVVQQDEDSSDDEEEDEQEDNAAPISYPSFVANSATSSALIEAEEDDNEEDESQTSIEANYHGPSAKRPSSKSQSSSRRYSHKSRKSSSASTSKGKQRKSWFGW